MKKQEFIGIMLEDGCEIVPGKMTAVKTPRGQVIKVGERQDDIAINVGGNLIYFDHAYASGGKMGKAEHVLLSKKKISVGKLRLREG